MYTGQVDGYHSIKEFDEIVAIADEAGIVRELPCPFHANDTCMLERLGQPYLTGLQGLLSTAPFMFMPAALARQIDRDMLRRLVVQKEIADAKVARMSRDHTFEAGPPFDPGAKKPWDPSKQYDDTDDEVARYKHILPAS